MKKLLGAAAIGSLALSLAACNDSDDASTDLEVDTVEMPADEALEPIQSEPVEDSQAREPEMIQGPPPVTSQTTVEAADRAESVAAEAAAAAEAADAAEAAANIEVE